MAGANTASASGTLTTSLPTVLSRFALLEQERGRVKNTATQETLPPHTGASFNMINYGLLQASAATEGVDAAQAQTLQDAKTSFTPGEIVANVIVGDRTIDRVADTKLLSEIGEMCMNAIELREDTDGCAKFSSFTPTLGTAGTVATLGHLLAGEAILRIGNSTATPEPAPGPWFAVLHPNTMAAAAVRTIPLAAGPGASSLGAAGVLSAAIVGGAINDVGMKVLMGKGLLRQLDMGELMVMSDANVALSSTDAINGIYSKKGLVYVSEKTPYMRQERDESLRGVEITAVCSYAWGVYRPAAYGVKSTFDATTPTS